MEKFLQKISAFVVVIICMGISVTHAQVNGRVIDDKKSGIPGLTVRVKNTNTAVITDANGMYFIKIGGNTAVLVFSAVGYLKEERSVVNNTQVDVTMKESSENMDEVVVVGFGTVKKVNLTGAVSVIKGEQLAKRQVASVSAALQGMAPGVTVTQQSGLPGSDAASIRIRGISSMFAGKDPLTLVDNVEMNINLVDPNTIQSISILKDAAAASIYGSRAANGVVLITTKRGADKKGEIQYNAYTGLQQATNLPDKVNGLEHMELYDMALVNVGRTPVFTNAISAYKATGPDNFSVFNTDWKDLMLTGNGLMQNHNLNFSTGTDKINVYASGTYLKQNGLTANTNLTRYDFRFNTNVKVLKNLSASMDIALNRSDRMWPGTSPNILMMEMIGLPANIAGKFDSGQYGEAWNNVNPIAQAEVGGFENVLNKSSVLTGTLTYNPIDDLKISATYSGNINRPRNRTLQKQYQVFLPDIANNVLVEGPIYPASNGLNESWTESAQHLFRTQVNYNKEVGKHTLGFLAGFSAEDFQTRNISGSRQNFINTEMPYLNTGDAGTMTNSGGISDWAILSFYSRINYHFQDKYLLEVNGRWDASSRFSAGNRWGFFPSLSAGWKISQESFWDDIKQVINESKIRFSYGVLGNQNLTSYPTVSQFSPGTANNYYFNNSITSGYAITQASNQLIQWESSKQLDVGIDMSLFNSKLTITADYFKRRIYDMLQTLPIPLMVGLSAPYVNAGSMENKGWELGLTWRDAVKDFRYGIQVNLSDVRNKVIDLNNQEYINGVTIIKEGAAIDSYYGYISDGLFQNVDQISTAADHFPTTKPGDVRYRDISGPNGSPDGLIDNFDRTVLGNSFPQYEYSLNLDASWKGFDLSMFFQGVGKRDNYMSGIGAWAFHSTNFQGSAYEFHKDYWSPENPDASYPRLTVGLDNNQKNSSYWIRSGAYLRFKNVVMGYTLPAALTNRLKIGLLRFYVSGQNLLTFDNFYKGFDPEKDNNTGQFYPIMKTYSLGLTLNFNANTKK